MASLTSLKRTGKRAYRRVGRGQSSTRGKQSGRGGKGQTARAGHKIRPAIRDIIKKLPKRRGYGKNRARTVNSMKPAVVAISLSKLSQVFDGGEVTRVALVEKGMIGRKDAAKIVGGETKHTFTLKGIGATASARSAIEKAGGSVASDK